MQFLFFFLPEWIPVILAPFERLVFGPGGPSQLKQQANFQSAGSWWTSVVLGAACLSLGSVLIPESWLGAIFHLLLLRTALAASGSTHPLSGMSVGTWGSGCSGVRG